MGWIISIVFAVLVSAGLFVVGKMLRKTDPRSDEGERTVGLVLMVAAPILLFVWGGLHTALASVHQISAGHVGVVYNFGDIIGQRDDGFQMIAPWQTMRVGSVQIQSHEFLFDEGNAAFSQETQDVFAKIILNYSVSPIAVQRLYRDVGPNWFDILITPRVYNFMKEETVKYKTVDIAPSRERIRNAVGERLKEELAPYSITVNDLLIQNVDFRPEFKQAVEKKQIATQAAQEAEQLVQKAKFEADSKIATARGDAEATRINAEGQAAANRVIGESLTPEVIQFQLVQKLAANIKIALVPSIGGLILDPSKLLEEK